MNPQVDAYLIHGCGRCPLFNTPQCKVHKWQEALVALRKLVLDCGLTEELKWSIPCYTYKKSNILVLSAFNDNCVLSFFKGGLLKDAEGILSKPGENTQVARVVRFTNSQEVVDLEAVLKAYILEAIEVEKKGLKGDYKKKPEAVPEEFQAMLDENAALRAAFERLTPGRQRGYILHFSQPKQAKTRVSRIDKCIDKILDGKGFMDR